jgi:RIO-like serine/threonine protein kinase
MAGGNSIAVHQKKLKADPFGTISHNADQSLVCRDTDECPWWAKAVARHLASREARALIVLNSLAGIPKLRDWNGRQLQRDWLEGLPMHAARPCEPEYFSQALSLLRKMHHHRIAHNDLAKEANCLVLSNGQPAFIDFQLSLHAPGRGFLFRQLAREDLRHLLKHKAYYCPDQLTARERHILANPSVGARLWTKLYKPVYLWFTRSILGWPEREGANERVYKDPH